MSVGALLGALMSLAACGPAVGRRTRRADKQPLTGATRANRTRSPDGNDLPGRLRSRRTLPSRGGHRACISSTRRPRIVGPVGRNRPPGWGLSTRRRPTGPGLGTEPVRELPGRGCPGARSRHRLSEHRGRAVRRGQPDGSQQHHRRLPAGPLVQRRGARAGGLQGRCKVVRRAAELDV